MLLSLPIALLDFIKGNRITDEQVQSRRDFCNGCEHKSAKLEVAYCNVCHCILEGELGKLNAPREKCPKGFW